MHEGIPASATQLLCEALLESARQLAFADHNNTQRILEEHGTSFTSSVDALIAKHSRHSTF